MDGKSKIIAVVIAFVGVFFLGPIRFVNPGYVGVVVRFGRTTGTVLSPGAHFVVPIADRVVRLSTKKLIYETTSGGKQKGSQADYKDYPVDTNTKDGQQVDIYYTVRFSIDPTKAVWVVNNIGNEQALVEKIVKTESRVWARIIPRKYTAEELYTGNVQDIAVEIEGKLKEKFSDNGVVLDAVGIREIKFTNEYLDAIEKKQIEAVRVETARNKAEQAKYEKEAKITMAEAQAREQELLRQTLTPELIKKMWIEKWDGKLPSVVSDNGVLLQLPQ